MKSCGIHGRGQPVPEVAEERERRRKDGADADCA